MTWPEIHAEKTFIDNGLPVAGPALVLPPERVKNGRKFIVPLSTAVQAILLTCPRGPDDTLVFRRNNAPKVSMAFARAWSRHKKMLDAALVRNGHNLEPWVLHDLRRSAATHMRRIGIARDTVEETLNHFRANVYIKGELEEAKRQALEAWGEHLMAHVEGRTPADNVLQWPIRA